MIPPAPRRPLGLPVAWWVSIGAAIGLSLGFSAFASTVFGQFVPSLSAEFGWSRAQTTLAVSFSNIPLLVMAPAFGALIDRLGAWRTLLFSQIVLPLIVMSLATLQGSLLQLYLSFFLIALLGAGTLPAAYTRIMLGWFDRRRGMAFGIAMSGVGMAALGLPPLVQGLIAAFGWRVALFAVGALFLAAGVLNVSTLLRVRPRASEIDGELAAAPDGDPEAEPGVSWRAAIRAPTYWLIALAFIPLGVASMGLLVNLPSILIDRRLSPGVAASMVSLLGMTLIVARLVTGWFLDNIRTAYVAAVIFGLPVCGFLLLAGADGLGPTALAVFLIAFGIGAEFDVMAFLISRFFGPVSYGRLYGGVYAAYNIGVAIGPVYIARGFDMTGEYSAPLRLFALLFLISGALLTWISLSLAPHRPPQLAPVRP